MQLFQSAMASVDHDQVMKIMDFALKIMDFALKIMDFALKMSNLVIVASFMTLPKRSSHPAYYDAIGVAKNDEFCI